LMHDMLLASSRKIRDRGYISFGFAWWTVRLELFKLGIAIGQ